MKVLLISPLDPKKPGNLKFLMGGENTYTQTLLAHPPKGVDYTHYTDALKDGSIKYSSWHKIINMAIKLRILPASPQIICFEVSKKFDLIHSHVHAVQISGIKIPVLLSDSSSNILFLKDYLGWGKWRIDIGYKIKKWLVKNLNIYDAELNLRDADLAVWSNFSKKIHRSLGVNGKKISVIPPGIEQLAGKKIKKSGFNILFIGIWFQRKGGNLVLKAYKRLKQKYPKISLTISLTIIGQIPAGIKLPQDVVHLDYMPRKEIIKNIYPQADILVLVPDKAEGYGMVIVEAASMGIPSIVSSVCALPELVENGKSGLVITPGSVTELMQALERLITDSILRKNMGKQAMRRFLNYFSIKKTNEKLLKVYLSAIKDKPKAYKTKSSK